MTETRKPARVASSTVAVGVASAFVALAALLSFTDEPADQAPGWRLRGTIAPEAGGGRPARLPAAPKRA